MNVLVALLRAYANPQIERGEQDQIILSDGNVKFRIANSSSGGTGQVQRMKLKDVLSDYLLCVPWDGTTEGVSTPVAKQYPLRNSLTGETILGLAHTYTYGAGPSETWAAGTSTRFNKSRTDSDGTLSESQRVIRPYVQNEEIFAIGAKTGIVDVSSIPITLLEISPNRIWSRIPE